MYLIIFNDGVIHTGHIFDTYKDAFKYAQENYYLSLEENRISIKKFDSVESITKFVVDLHKRNSVLIAKHARFQEQLVNFLFRGLENIIEEKIDWKDGNSFFNDIHLWNNP